MNPTTHRTEGSAPAPVLTMALELSNRSWRLAFGDGAKHRQVSVPAADLAALASAVAKAKERFKMSASVRVVSCYEAGRDGFWLHRHLVSIGIENQVVDAASIEVSRRLRLGGLTLWDGRHLPVELKAELERERERLVLVERQIEQLEATRRERLQNPRSEAERSVVHLMRLEAIGPTSAWRVPACTAGRGTTTAFSVGTNWVTSCRFAAVTMIDSGTPRASTNSIRLLPFFPPVGGVTDWCISARAGSGSPAELTDSPRINA